MKRLLSISLATLFLFAAPGLVPEASADHRDWIFGTAFRVGSFFFKIGFHPDAYHRRGDYYVRVRERVSYPDYSCSRYCYRDDTHYYHHRSCPVINHHFSRYDGYSRYMDRYFPRNDRYYGGGHDYGHSYGHGYSRDRSRYRDRGHYRDRGQYRDRGHYRGHGYGHHRHTPSCGHRY
jgi:hypothetical protein